MRIESANKKVKAPEQTEKATGQTEKTAEQTEKAPEQTKEVPEQAEKATGDNIVKRGLFITLFTSTVIFGFASFVCLLIITYSNWDRKFYPGALFCLACLTALLGFATYECSAKTKSVNGKTKEPERAEKEPEQEKKAAESDRE
jgi:hypothetical protein